MLRNFQILKNQFMGHSWRQRFNLIKTALFIDKSIHVYSQNLPRTSVEISTQIDGATIEKGNFRTLALAIQKIEPLPWEFQCHEYDGVKDFFVVRDGHGIRHISWVYFHNQRNRILSLSEQEAEIKFCLTLPKFRGQGLYPKVLCSIMDYLESTGIIRAFICAEQNNHPSIRGIERAGFRRVGQVRLRKLMGFQVSSRLNTKRIQ